MKNIIKVSGLIILALLVIAFIIIYILVLKPNSDINKNRAAFVVKDSSEMAEHTDSIHFMRTDSSDAILIESNGHYALVDCAEDSDNPRGLPELVYKGYENEVLDYLKKNAMGKDGKVHLDFVLGTHSHSDHIGGFDTVILDEDVIIDKAYLKKYNEDIINIGEIQDWDNKEVYQQMVDALNSRSIPIIADVVQPSFKLGNLDITLYNTEYHKVKPGETIGENENSFGVLVEKNGTRVFLAGDINNYIGDEDRIGKELGEINLLKVGHHSYSHSTTTGWLRNLQPDVCVVTNEYEKTDKRTLRRITRISKSPILVTGSENGVVAVLGDNGQIDYYNNIH